MVLHDLAVQQKKLLEFEITSALEYFKLAEKNNKISGIVPIDALVSVFSIKQQIQTYRRTKIRGQEYYLMSNVLSLVDNSNLNVVEYEFQDCLDF